LVDVVDKGRKTFKAEEKNPQRNLLTVQAAVDCALWQGFASVIIPGFTINRLVSVFSLLARQPSMNKLPSGVKKWSPTILGLLSIPIIFKPIDHGVEWVMDNSLRRFYLGGGSHSSSSPTSSPLPNHGSSTQPPKS